MIFVGIDVAKDKHDVFILHSDSEVPQNVFSFSNNRMTLKLFFKRFSRFLRIWKRSGGGLEATGHYNYN